MDLATIPFNQPGAHDLVDRPVATFDEMLWPSPVYEVDRSLRIKADHQINKTHRGE